MKNPVVFMFAGQGSHYYQMGREFFIRYPLFRDWMEIADEIYKKITGLSVIDVLYDEHHSKNDSFHRTLLTHPAIVMVEHALAQVLLAKGVFPSYTLGTSLGEFSSAVFSNILTFESMLRAAIAQAQILESSNTDGRMLAILEDSILYEQLPWLHQHTTLAAVNCDKNFIISGGLEELDLVEGHLCEHKLILWQRLSISQGFHSSILDKAYISYKQYLQTLVIDQPRLPFISCLTGDVLETVNPTHFWDVIRQPILFQKTIDLMENRGAYNYVDLSPSGTLATFVKRNLVPTSQSKVYALMSPYQHDVNRFNTVLAELAS